MRVSDIVKLIRDDVRNSDGSMKQHITVIEKKHVGIFIIKDIKILLYCKKYLIIRHQL